MTPRDYRFIPNDESRKIKEPNKYLILFELIFTIIIPIKWKIFKETVKDKFKRRIIIIK
jgi:hypothetical protein